MIEAISIDHAVEVLAGERRVSSEACKFVTNQYITRQPIVDVGRFDEGIQGLMALFEAGDTAPPQETRQEVFWAVTTLGSSSLAFAMHQAGDIAIPRPRRLHEHNQSVLNMRLEYGEHSSASDKRARILPVADYLKDAGKSHCVAMTGSSKKQAQYNDMFATTLLRHVPENTLDRDQKKVIKLLVAESFIGRALRHHAGSSVLRFNIIEAAHQGLETLRQKCPDDYRDCFDGFLLSSYAVDAGAHTQRAYYTDAATGEVCQDVIDSQVGVNTSLDAVFSMDPEHESRLRFHDPGHLAVLARLFQKQF